MLKDGAIDPNVDTPYSLTESPFVACAVGWGRPERGLVAPLPPIPDIKSLLLLKWIATRPYQLNDVGAKIGQKHRHEGVWMIVCEIPTRRPVSGP